MTIVYLAEVGFRAAGVRLVRPVRAMVEGRTLTLGDLAATPEVDSHSVVWLIQSLASDFERSQTNLSTKANGERSRDDRVSGSWKSRGIWFVEVPADSHFTSNL